MPAFHTGIVTRITEERRGLQRVVCDLSGSGRDADERAYVLTGLVGAVSVGDRVVVNTTAVDLGLGTGGWHVVHWNLERHELVSPGPGHIMKLRYTSLQADTGAIEEHDPAVPPRLDGMPVVVCGLHSQMGCVALAFHAARPDARLVYVMTDGAALPLALSDLVHGLREQDVLAATITAGNSFGGDLESVTVPSAITVARHRLDADAVVVAMGPGVTGTGSTLGTTGVETASVLDGVAALGGRAIMALRVSEGDARERHRGVSHHSLTSLELCRAATTVAVAEPTDLPGRHRVAVAEPPDMAALVEASGLGITTMGRGPHEDPAFFAAAGAAGTFAAGLLGGEDDR
ncbi:MAG: DUF3866 family protein [Acidimicrobiia bacterium]|nr:DUF3866 family protein [Acidimicrobiia bacterium]